MGRSCVRPRMSVGAARPESRRTRLTGGAREHTRVSSLTACQPRSCTTCGAAAAPAQATRACNKEQKEVLVDRRRAAAEKEGGVGPGGAGAGKRLHREAGGRGGCRTAG